MGTALPRVHTWAGTHTRAQNASEAAITAAGIGSAAGRRVPLTYDFAQLPRNDVSSVRAQLARVHKVTARYGAAGARIARLAE